MKKEIIKLTVISVIYTFVGCTNIDSVKNVYKTERKGLISVEYEIKLPQPFHVQHECTGEAIIYSYSFPDTVYLIIIEGGLTKFGIDYYEVENMKSTNTKIISTGVHNGRFWRRDQYKGTLTIYYDWVQKKNKKKYDKILDNIKIKTYNPQNEMFQKNKTKRFCP